MLSHSMDSEKESEGSMHEEDGREEDRTALPVVTPMTADVVIA